MKMPNDSNGHQNSEELHANQEDERIKEESESNFSKSDHISFYMPTVRLPTELNSALRTVLASA